MLNRRLGELVPQKMPDVITQTGFPVPQPLNQSMMTRIPGISGAEAVRVLDRAEELYRIVYPVCPNLHRPHVVAAQLNRGRVVSSKGMACGEGKKRGVIRAHGHTGREH